MPISTSSKKINKQQLNINIMTPKRNYSKFPKVKNALVKGTFLLTVSGLVAVHTGCGTGESMEQEWETVTTKEPTGGMVTTVEETEKDVFKIVDEVAVPKKEDSRIIAQYLDGTADTMTLEQAKLLSTDDGSGSTRRSGMSSVLMYGMMGYWMGKRMSQPINQSAYKNQQTYNRVNNNVNSKVQRTAQVKTTRVPKNSKTGFGKSSSRTRSFGG